jgi:hypothetical protein
LTEGGGDPADFGHDFSASNLPTPGHLSDSWAATFSVSPAAALFERENHKAAACASVGEDAEFDEFGDDWEWIFADQAFSEMRDDFERDMGAQGLQWDAALLSFGRLEVVCVAKFEVWRRCNVYR